ncbi:DNA polymerase III subunit gamma/tau [Marinococcus halophilus]|uniref:DNA polymerase III subunit gamma/tau n=1 Tax=Marinococcus halophilus TaxID=1371 RepID=UPI0009A6E963|nr:DNA polymerase III subunit gamma/tau [Marinococcus halophilus]
MGHQALYRMWRPQLLEDVVGQEHITKTLQNALVQEKFSHAYLFSGPRGTGKTSAAKIFAKAINCAQAPTAEPCNECDACTGIMDGSVVDVIEIDAASNNGVDEIRYIRENVIAAPRDIRYKVYIIDEVHMLSTGAFNALLKTLEEPPKHAVFILATTEPHKIPLTIVSRCQRFDFKRIQPETLVERMKYILGEQQETAEEQALYLIARAAEGGMRDALSLLDQAMSFAEEAVRAEDVLAITGAVSQQFLTDTVRALKEQNTAEAVQAADRLVKEGKDPVRFMEDIIYYLRDMLLNQAAPGMQELLDRATLDQEFEALSSEVPAEWIYQRIDQLNKIHQDMRWSSHPKIFLEVALIQSCHTSAKEAAPVSESGASDDRTTRLENRIASLEKALKEKPAAPAAPEQAPPAAEEPKPEPAKRASKKGATSSPSQGKVKEILKTATKQELQDLANQWNSVMNAMRARSVPGHAWLNNSKPVIVNETAVLLSFKNEMHRNMIETKFREEVIDALREITGKELEPYTILSNEWERIKEEYKQHQQENGTEAAESEAPEAPENSQEEPPDPLVEEAVKRFGSEFVEVVDH